MEKSFQEYEELRAFGNVNKYNNNIKCRRKKMKGIQKWEIGLLSFTRSCYEIKKEKKKDLRSFPIKQKRQEKR